MMEEDFTREDWIVIHKLVEKATHDDLTFEEAYPRLWHKTLRMTK